MVLIQSSKNQFFAIWKLHTFYDNVLKSSTHHDVENVME